MVEFEEGEDDVWRILKNSLEIVLYRAATLLVPGGVAVWHVALPLFAVVKLICAVVVALVVYLQGERRWSK